MASRRRMVASLVIADLCTVTGFGSLSFSGIPVLYGIGLTVAIGAGLSLLFGAILTADRGKGRLDKAPRGSSMDVVTALRMIIAGICGAVADVWGFLRSACRRVCCRDGSARLHQRLLQCTAHRDR